MWILKPRICSILLHPEWIHNSWALWALHPLTLFHHDTKSCMPRLLTRRGLMWDPSLPAQLQQAWDTAQPGHSPAAAFPHPPASQNPATEPSLALRVTQRAQQEAQAVNSTSKTCQGSWCISNWVCSEEIMSLPAHAVEVQIPKSGQRSEISPDTPGCYSWLYKQRAYTSVRPSISLTSAMKKLCCSLTFRGFIVCLPTAAECLCLNYTTPSLFTH